MLKLRSVPISCPTKRPGCKVTKGVEARLQQSLSIKTVIKFTIRHSVLQITVLQVFYDNLINNFLFFFVSQALRTQSRFIPSVKSFSAASTVRSSRCSPDMVDRKKFFISFILQKVLSFFATLIGAVNSSLKHF